MKEQGLISKQPGTHAYKKSTVERPDIPNILDRQFTVEAPNTVWCGDITYIWAQGKWQLFRYGVFGGTTTAIPETMQAP